MRRRSGTAPFQLFSFQDIITSVMGIVVLILLVLALELSQRQLQSPAVGQAAVRHRTQEAIADAEVEIARIRTELDASTIAQTAGISLADIAARKLALDRVQPQVESQLSSARRQKLRLETLLEKRTKESESEMLAAQLKEKLNKVSKLEERLKEWKEKTRIVYRTALSDGRQAWLVELNAKAFLSARVGSREPPVRFEQPDINDRTVALLRWTDRMEPNLHLLHILVKPGGAGAFSEIEPKLRRRGFALGFDVVGAAQIAIDPTIGAGTEPEL